MGNNPLDVIGNQVSSFVNNQVRMSVGKIRRETSIVQQANQLASSAIKRANKAKQRPKSKKSGVYVGPEARKAPSPVKADGYVRRSPVQPVVVPSWYRSRLMKRIIGGTIVAVIVGVVFYVLLQYIAFN